MTLDKNNSSIQILVSHEWDADDNGIVSIYQDKKWKPLRKLIKKVTDDVKKRSENRPGDRKLDIQIKRLRGQHGQFILKALLDRIEQGDILIVDIGGERHGEYNPNVLIELGIALGMGKLDSENLFILKPVSLTWPSDLHGILYTDYEVNDDSLKLKDAVGFHAALRGTLMNLARQKNMLGDVKQATVSIEGEEDE